MQIKVNNTFNNIYINNQNKVVSNPNKELDKGYNVSFQINFQAMMIQNPVMSTKINNEKLKLIRKLTEIAKTNVPILTKDQLWEIIERRAYSIMRMKSRKKDMILIEREVLYNMPANFMSYQQKLDKQAQLDREEKELNKIDPFEIPDYLIPPKVKENYDYNLIAKLKEALIDNNFDLKKVFHNHYTGLNEIKTVKELKEKYPSIIVPPTVEDVLCEKIINTFTRDIFERIDEAGKNEQEKDFTDIMLGEVLKKVYNSLENFGIKDFDFINNVYLKVIDGLTNNCIETVQNNRLDTKARVKNETPNFTDIDRNLVDINYDKFVLHVIREIYLGGKKLNDITYQEGDKIIKLSDLKNSEYKFEKLSEKIKKIITDSEKIQAYQREYQKFTPNELKDRMLFYEQTELGNEPTIFNLFVEFEGCKFTQEDKQYLIKFLQKLDEISDKKISLEEGIEYLVENNIHPHGTNKINQARKKEIEEQIKIEQQKKLKLEQVRKDFNAVINNLYEKELISEANLFAKYYPETYSQDNIEKAEDIINFISECLKTNDIKTCKTKILRWETYNDFLKNDTKSSSFKDGVKYCTEIGSENVADIVGQYLLNRELIDNYPQSRKLVSEPDLLAKVMENFGSNKDFATRLLCKYENYKSLTDEEKSFITNILEIFDSKNSNERILLKHIIENDYINYDTTKIVERENKPQPRTICSSAKLQLFDKYNFPNSIPFFEKFEQALLLDAPFRGGAGVKKLTRNHKNHQEKAEIKIMGHDDRLVADKDDFRFNRFDPKGIH